MGRMTLDEARNILGIGPYATSGDIRSAYKRLALKCHPDKMQNTPESTAQFQMISAAYKRLTNTDEDEFDIDDDYTLDLFREMFKSERHVVHVHTEKGDFVILGPKIKSRRYSNGSEDDFDASHYSFQKQTTGNTNQAEGEETVKKKNKNKQKKQRQRENKRQAKETLLKEREELKQERQKTNTETPVTQATATIPKPKNSQKDKKNEEDNQKESEKTNEKGRSRKKEKRQQKNKENQKEKVDHSSESQKKNSESRDRHSSNNQANGKRETSNGKHKSPTEKQGNTKPKHENLQQKNGDSGAKHENSATKLETSTLRSETSNGKDKNSGSKSQSSNSNNKSSSANAQRETPNLKRENSDSKTENASSTKLENSNLKPEKASGAKSENSKQKRENSAAQSETLNGKDKNSNSKLQPSNSSNKSSNAQVETSNSKLQNSNIKPEIRNGQPNRYNERPEDRNGKRNDKNAKHENTNGKRESPNQNQSTSKPKQENSSLKRDTSKDGKQVVNGATRQPSREESREKKKGKQENINEQKQKPVPVGATSSNKVNQNKTPAASSTPNQPQINKTNLRTSNGIASNQTNRPINNGDNRQKTVPTKPGNDSALLATQGNHKASEGKFAEAIALFTQAIQIDPTNYRLYGNRSFCFERMQQYVRSLQDAEKAIDYAPMWSKGYFRKGRALTGLKKYTEAEIAFETVLKFDKECHDAQLEIYHARVNRLKEMGFSQQQSILALRRYTTVDEAIEKMLEGELTEAAVQDVYVSDDDEDEYLEEDSSTSTSEVHLPVFTQPQAPNLEKPIQKKAPSRDLRADNKKSVPPPKKDPTLLPNPEDRDHRKEGRSAVWSGNVTTCIKEEHLRNYFKQFGPIQNVKIDYAKKYAIISFNDEGAASKALRKKYVPLRGTTLTLDYPVKRFVPNRMKDPSTREKSAPIQKTNNAKPANNSTQKSSDISRECFYWRKNGCSYGPNCKFLHIPENQGIDSH